METIYFVFKLEKVLSSSYAPEDSHKDLAFVESISNNKERKNNITEEDEDRLREIYKRSFSAMYEYDVKTLRKEIWDIFAKEGDFKQKCKTAVTKLGNFYSMIKRYYSDLSVVKSIVVDALLSSVKSKSIKEKRLLISEFLLRRNWDSSYKEGDCRREKADLLMKKLDIDIQELCYQYLPYGLWLTFFDVREVGVDYFVSQGRLMEKEDKFELEKRG